VRRLQVAAEALSSQRLLRQQAAEVLRVFGGDPAQAFCPVSPDHQSEIWQARSGCALRL